MDNDDSSFNPYASSSRRLSSDVFSDQQSQDSFFVTKNKTESLSIPPQLDRIPEVGKSSNLDITPSGNMEDLENSKGKMKFLKVVLMYSRSILFLFLKSMVNKKIQLRGSCYKKYRVFNDVRSLRNHEC